MAPFMGDLSLLFLKEDKSHFLSIFSNFFKYFLSIIKIKVKLHNIHNEKFFVIVTQMNFGTIY